MNELNNYKFHGHETFYVRKGWLYKGLKNVVNNSRVFTDKSINASDAFGLGVSMVKSLRYWLQAFNLTVEKRENRETIQELTELGKIIYEYDRYIEETGTLCLLQYQLATNESMATSWYYFFNEFNIHDFTKEDFVDSLTAHLKFKQIEPAKKTLESEYICLLNTYLKKETTDPEDNLESPFGELELIQQSEKKFYKKSAPKDGYIPLQILLAMIVAQHPKETEIKISDLLKEKNNVGKVFNLGLMSLSNYLDKLQIEGYIQVVRTAGLDVIKLRENKTWIEYVIDYYESIKN